MQFLIYIHCHVVIILPLRCYSSSKRHRLYNQPAKIYLKSSLVICMLTCFIRSRNTNNLLKQMCSRYGTYCERYRIGGAPSISDGHSAHRWSRRRAAKVSAKLIFLCCMTVPVVIFCVHSKTVSSLPSRAKHLFISTVTQSEAVASAPVVCWMLRYLPFWQRLKTSEALTPVFTYCTRSQTCVSLYFLNIAFWGKLSAIISGVSLNLYFCSVECRCHLECKRELSEPSLSPECFDSYSVWKPGICYPLHFLEGLLNMRT